MVGIIDVPGTRLHQWRWFNNRTQAQDWVDRRVAEIRETQSRGIIPTRVVSDREASKVRWADGRRVYGSEGAGPDSIYGRHHMFQGPSEEDPDGLSC